jgi:FkbM family methyltransferase
VKEPVRTLLSGHPRLLAAARSAYRAFARDRLREPSLARVQSEVRRALRNASDAFFVQVGSNDGLQGDPIHDLILENADWSGIFIEPVGFVFERLKENYGEHPRFIFERCAVSRDVGTAPFYYVSEGALAALGGRLPYWYDQLGSFDRNHILRFLGPEVGPFIVEEHVPTAPMSAILSAHRVGRIDLLHIDTEGFDYVVLSQVDLMRYRPRVILYEHKHLRDEDRVAARALLSRARYKCIELGGDTLARRRG